MIAVFVVGTIVASFTAIQIARSETTEIEGESVSDRVILKGPDGNGTTGKGNVANALDLKGPGKSSSPVGKDVLPGADNKPKDSVVHGKIDKGVMTERDGSAQGTSIPNGRMKVTNPSPNVASSHDPNNKGNGVDSPKKLDGSIVKVPEDNSSELDGSIVSVSEDNSSELDGSIVKLPEDNTAKLDGSIVKLPDDNSSELDGSIVKVSGDNPSSDVSQDDEDIDIIRLKKYCTEKINACKEYLDRNIQDPVTANDMKSKVVGIYKKCMDMMDAFPKDLPQDDKLQHIYDLWEVWASNIDISTTLFEEDWYDELDEYEQLEIQKREKQYNDDVASSIYADEMQQKFGEEIATLKALISCPGDQLVIREEFEFVLIQLVFLHNTDVFGNLEENISEQDSSTCNIIYNDIVQKTFEGSRSLNFDEDMKSLQECVNIINIARSPEKLRITWKGKIAPIVETVNNITGTGNKLTLTICNETFHLTESIRNIPCMIEHVNSLSDVHNVDNALSDNATFAELCNNINTQVSQHRVIISNLLTPWSDGSGLFTHSNNMILSLETTSPDFTYNTLESLKNMFYNLIWKVIKIVDNPEQGSYRFFFMARAIIIVSTLQFHGVIIAAITSLIALIYSCMISINEGDDFYDTLLNAKHGDAVEVSVINKVFYKFQSEISVTVKDMLNQIMAHTNIEDCLTKTT